MGKSRFLLVALLAFFLGILRFSLALPHFTTTDIAFYRDVKMDLTIQGFIVDEVDLRSDRQYLVLEVQRLFYENQWLTVHGLLLLKAQRYPQFHYGDELQVSGPLISPPSFEKFSYADALAKEDIYVVCYKPKIRLLSPGRGHFFWTAVFGLKDLLSQRINELFTEPEASLVAGLLMGLRRAIPAEVLDDFSRAGLTHILAISGYNITLMITLFGLLFCRFGRRFRFFGVLSGIWLFLLFTGFSASVIRAAWMGFFTILAIVLGRKNNGLISLLLSGAVMILLNPRILMFDLSFQLSFLATLGLIMIVPFWQKYFSKLPPFLSEGLAVTLAAQVFTTPLIISVFGRFSLISPLANILFLPLIPLIMLFSFVGVLVSFIFPPFAIVLNAIAWLLLKILIGGVTVVANIPFASIEF